jgi:hypothetical protein
MALIQVPGATGLLGIDDSDFSQVHNVTNNDYREPILMERIKIDLCAA